jgi:hypothetical protein
MNFESTAKRYGLELWKGRVERDIDEVAYRGIKLFSVPAKINRFENPVHHWRGMPLPNYHQLDRKARIYKYVILNPTWFQNTLQEYANQKFNPQEYEVPKQDTNF